MPDRLHCPNCGRHWPRRAGYVCLGCRTIHPDAERRRVDVTDQGAQLVIPGAERHDPPPPAPKPRKVDARQRTLDL